MSQFCHQRNQRRVQSNPAHAFDSTAYFGRQTVDSKQVTTEPEHSAVSPASNPRKGKLIWLVVVLASAVASIAIWLVFSIPARVALLSGCAGVFATCFAVAPYVRFIDHGWWARYDEFRNQLWGEALSEYLWQFWHRRGADANALHDFSSGKPAVEADDAKRARWKNASALFDLIYKEQYGLMAFVTPLGFLLTAVLVGAQYVTIVSLRDLLPGSNDIFSLVKQISPHGAALSVSAIFGAYLFVVGDCVDSVRKGILNVADVYWYSLRMILAVPIATALTFALPDAVAVNVAFALGVLPVAFINKQLRRFASLQLKSEVGQEPDQIIKLEGVTAPIVSLLDAEGVTSIEQLLGMDPVLLSIHTGLPFRFVLRLGAQAVVRRHFGEAGFALSGLGLADATSVYSLIRQLTGPDADASGDADAASKVINEAYILLKGISKSDWPQQESVRFRFEEVARFAYTHFLMAAGFDRAPHGLPQAYSTANPKTSPASKMPPSGGSEPVGEVA
ncbi:hypothetical protein [Paraburkholderia dinghuensis]|nr:hypothetical protein [Paraburkholderia dinghuensis]